MAGHGKQKAWSNALRRSLIALPESSVAVGSGRVKYHWHIVYSIRALIMLERTKTQYYVKILGGLGNHPALDEISYVALIKINLHLLYTVKIMQCYFTFNNFTQLLSYFCTVACIRANACNSFILFLFLLQSVYLPLMFEYLY